MARPIGNGLVVALGIAVVWALLSAVLGFHVGLVVVAAFGGWLISIPYGYARNRLILASILDFVLSQALLPAATTALPQRLTPAAYFDYVSGTFDVISVISIALLVIVAWRSAR